MTKNVDELPVQLHENLPRPRRIARNQLDPFDERTRVCRDDVPCERA